MIQENPLNNVLRGHEKFLNSVFPHTLLTLEKWMTPKKMDLMVLVVTR